MTSRIRSACIVAGLMTAGLMLLVGGCTKRTPDLSLTPVTPVIAVAWPATGDTVYPGRVSIQYDMENFKNATSFQLFVNDSLASAVNANIDKKKPVLAWDVDTLLLDTRVSCYITAFDIDSNKATSQVMRNILITRSPTKPAAPDNLQLFRFGATSVNLTWDDVSSNETAFEVWKKVSTSDFIRIQTLPRNSVSTNDSGIVDGLSYQYKVRAVNSYGYADSKPASIGKDIVVMAPPTNLSATALGTKMIQLNWEDNSDGELAFVIQRRITSGSVYTQVGLAGPNETTFIDTTKLVASSSYTYRVAARGQFEQSTWSNEETVLTLYIDTYPPSDLNALFDQTAKSVKLSWKSNTFYDSQTRIERRPEPGGLFVEIGKVGTSATSFSDTSVHVQSQYSYRVRVLSVDGHFTPYSNTVAVTTVASNTPSALIGRRR